MNKLRKLIAKLEGNVPLLILAFLFIIGVVVGILLLSGLLLAVGFNLMGFHIPYNISTSIGGAIIISLLRSGIGSNGGK